jgi:hypothetical protein
MVSVALPEVSRYIRTTWMLTAQTPLRFSNQSQIRFIDTKEAEELAQLVRKRNVFARHSWENHFYVQRARALAEHTVIEVFQLGDPQEIANRAEKVARILEKLTVLSSTFTIDRSQVQKRLGISEQSGSEVDFIIGPQFRFLRSREKPQPTTKGLDMNSRFINRFVKCGFSQLADYLQVKSNMGTRVALSVDWLFDSRTDPRLTASVVKTAIALESLLIFSETESLAQTLSERVAFILSPDPSRRQLISRIVKRFYEARSGVVHGSYRKAKKLTPSLVEIIDRLAIMSHLVLAANADLWPSTDTLREWCEQQRWGGPSANPRMPFPDIYLRNALRVSKKELEQSQ